MARYELTEFEWKVIQPLLPNKPRGVPRVDDRRVLNGIFWVLRSGSPWADVPERYGPPTTVYNRFNRWRKAGVWDRLMDAIIAAHDGKVQMIDSSVVRVHQQAAACRTPAQRSARRSGCHRRQGIRRGLDQGPDRGAELHSTYPAEIKPLRRHHLQQSQIQEAQPHRALLQQAQAVPPHRDPLRPQRSQLPRYDQNRLRPPLAQVL